MSNLLVEKATLWSEQNNRRRFCLFGGYIRFYRLHRFKDGLGLKDHTGSTTIGIVINGMMFIMGIVSNIVNINLNQLLVNSPLENAYAEWVLEHLGEQG